MEKKPFEVAPYFKRGKFIKKIQYLGTIIFISLKMPIVSFHESVNIY